MVNYCRVLGCTNRTDRENHLKYYRLPKVIKNQGEECQKLSEERRRLWLAKLNQDLRGKNLDNIRICSAHFLSGKKSDLYRKDDPDWVPSVGMTGQRRGPLQSTKETLQASRYERRINRTQKRQKVEAPAAAVRPVAVKTKPVAVKTEPVAVMTEPVAVKTEPVAVKTEPDAVMTEPDAVKTEDDPTTSDYVSNNFCCTGTQTDLTGDVIEAMTAELQSRRVENIQFSYNVANVSTSSDQSAFVFKDEKVPFFPGLPTFRDANSTLFGISRLFHVCLGDVCESCRSEEFFSRVSPTVKLECLHQTSK